MAKRGQTWGFEETNLLLDVWADTKIQLMIDDCPKRNIEAFEKMAKKANELKATFVRSGADCRAKVKRLKVKYFEEKRKQHRSGNSKTNFAYWEKMDRVLGTRPISRPVSSLDSMTCSETREGKKPRQDSVAEQMKEKYGEGQTLQEPCPRCGTTVELLSSGVHDTEGGSLRVYSCDDILICPKCNYEALPADSEMEPCVPSAGSDDCAMHEVELQHADENKNISISTCADSGAFKVKSDKKKKKTNEKTNVQKMLNDFEKKESERFEKFIKVEQEREEKRRKIEEEQEEKREERENERFERQMQMITEMQMKMMSTFLMAGVGACGTASDQNAIYQMGAGPSCPVDNMTTELNAPQFDDLHL